MKTIGLDLDGVLANFYDGYERLTRQLSGRDLFPARATGEYPPTWNWPEFHGYSADEMRRVWTHIKDDRLFWQSLLPLPDMDLARRLSHRNIVYFITDRCGSSARFQSESWLMFHGISVPSVLISAEKGLCAKALALDIYVDDKAENIAQCVAAAPGTRAYLLERPYNQHVSDLPRAKDLAEVVLANGLMLF